PARGTKQVRKHHRTRGVACFRGPVVRGADILAGGAAKAWHPASQDPTILRTWFIRVGAHALAGAAGWGTRDENGQVSRRREVPGRQQGKQQGDEASGAQEFSRFSSTIVRIRSPRRATSNGFLNDSVKPKLTSVSGAASSSLARAMIMVCSYCVLRRRFWAICSASLRPMARSMMIVSGWKLSA